MLHIVINTKGGVGKSTVASQFLTAYASYKQDGKNKVSYAEIDDQNQNLKNLENSEIVAGQMIDTEMIDYALTEIAIGRDDMVVDVGGNITAANTLKALADQGGMFNGAVYYVPVLDSKQDMQNASDTISQIRDFEPDAHIFLVLNRCINRDHAALTADQFAFIKGKPELDIAPMKLDKNITVIGLNSNSAYNLIGLLKKTVVEVSNGNFDEQLREVVAKSRSGDAASQKVAKRLMTLKRLSVQCKKILTDEYAPLFKEIDKVISKKDQK